MYACFVGQEAWKHEEVREQLAGVCSSTMWVLRIELRWAGLVTSVLHCAISLADPSPFMHGKSI